MSLKATGTWEAPHDSDWFRIHLEAGQSYTVRINGQGSTYVVQGPGMDQVHLFYPELRGETSSGNALGHFTASVSGDYWFAAVGETAGTYTIDVNAISDDYDDNASSDGVFIGGKASGIAEATGDSDWFGAELVAGTQYTYNLDRSDGFGVFIIDASGNIVDQDLDGDPTFGVFTPTTSGHYEFVVMESSGNTAFKPTTYTLKLGSPNYPDDYRGDSATTGVVALATVGGLASGSSKGAWEHAEDSDWFKASLQADRSYVVSIAAEQTDSALLYVRDGNGAITGLAVSGLGHAFSAQSSGSVFLDAQAIGAASAYTVKIAEYKDDYTDNSRRAGTVTTNGVAAKGVWEVGGDSDWYAVQLTAGQSYSLKLSGGTFPGTAEFVRADGHGLGTAITATATGTYYVSTLAFPMLTSTSSYQIAVKSYADDFQDNASTSGILAVNGTKAGVTEVAGDTDWLKVTLQADKAYAFDLTKGAGELAIFDAAGNVVGDDYLRPAAGGTFFVSVSGAASGSYTVRARQVSDDYAQNAGSTGVFDGYVITGGSGNEVLRGTSGGDTINGNDGNDSLFGADGDDTLNGGSGDDVLQGGQGSDYLDGGVGRDHADYAGLFRTYKPAISSSSVLTLKGPATEGTDTLKNIEETDFADGIFVLDTNSDGAQVQRLYDAVLHRAPDQAGLESWLDRMHDDHWSINQVADYFLASPEFQKSGANVATNGAFVDFLYNQVLHRAPEAAGRADWISRLDAGLSRSDALLFFSESNEHKGATSAITGQGFFETDDAYQTIALLYDSFADRLPDSDGLKGWAEALESGSMSVQQIAAGFAASDEFKSRTAGLDHGQLVDFMYHNTLNREPDAPGRAGWVDALDHGLTTGDMLLTFATSQEHQNLMAPYIYGGIATL